MAVLSLFLVFRGQRDEKKLIALSLGEKSELAQPAALKANKVSQTAARASSDPMHDFTEWTKDYLSMRNPDLISKGVKLAQERHPVFKALIMEDPREAIAKAVPMVVRQKLPPEIVSLLEKRMNHVGAIRVMQGVPLDRNDPPVPTYREVELEKGGTYRAYVYGEREKKLTWTAGAYVNGVAMDSEFAISDEPTRRLEVGEILPAGKPVVGDCPVSGKYVIEPQDVPAEVPETLAAVETPIEIITFCDGSHIAIQNQTILYGEGVTGGSMAFSGILPSAPTPSLGQIKVLAMNVTYADQNVPPSTEEKLYATLRDVADHYSKASYGRLSLVGVVTPPIKLPHNEAWYVNRDGSNGGDIGGTGISHADARNEARKLGFDTNDYDCHVMRHNGGPGSYGGLAGGSTVWCRSDDVGLWAHEIGHTFGLGHSNFWDTAGTSSIGNGANNEYGDIFDVMGGGGTPSGHYNAQGKNQIRWLPANFLQPVTQSGLYRIHAFDQHVLDSRLRYALTIQKDSQRTYWGMVRSLFESNPFAKNGLVFGWRFPNGGGGNFQLIDTTNGSPFGKTDSPISLGATFGDTESGIYVTTVAANDNPRYLDVQVNLGTFPGNNAPSMTLAASAEVIPLNSTVTFTAAANDVDGDVLAYNWQHFGSTTQIVSPNSNVITRQFTAAGTFIVTCTVSDMKGGTVTRNKLITVGTSTTFTISGRVTLMGEGLPDVVVTANNANGVISDADGYFTIPNLAANTYTLTPLLYGYSFSELFNNSIVVGPSFSGANFDATAQSVVTITALNPNANELSPVTPGSFRLTRTGDLSQDLVVNVNSALGGATITTDYTFSPAYVSASQGYSTFTIPADSDTLDISVTPVVDALSEGTETVILQLGPGNGYLVGSASSATVVIADDDTALPKIGLTATRNSVMENIATPGLFTISRTGSTAAALAVNYTVSGTAGSGTDFSALTGSVAILAGNASATVEVVPVDDSSSESLETAILTLNTNAAYILDPLATTATATIYDDDLQTVNVIASDAEATEVDLSVPSAVSDTGTFLITRTGDTSSSLTIYYAFSGIHNTGVMALHGVDYEWMPGLIQIPAGQSSAAITIVPRFDSLGEGVERCVLNLGANATNYILGSSASATVNINDNAADTPYLEMLNTSNATEGTNASANFRITLRDATGGAAFPLQLGIGGTADKAADYKVTAWAAQTSGITTHLRGLWISGGSNLWAVGDSGRILKGDGSTWTAQTSGTTNALRGIWGSSTTSLWAVGDGGTIRRSTDGTAWAAQTSGTTTRLRGIWGSSATSLWVVGDSGLIRRSTDGTAWSAQASSTTSTLHAVWGTDASNVWAVGDGGTILKWNGTAWSAQTSGTTASLRGIWGSSATNLWAVGTGGVILKGNGTTWTAQASSITNDLSGVWGSDDNNVWISGTSGWVLRTLNGGTLWQTSRVTTGNPSFQAVAGADADNVWCLGDSGNIREARTVDFSAATVTANFPASSSSLDLIIWQANDALAEDQETISVTLLSSAAYQFFPISATSTAWLRDNDSGNTLVVDTQVGTGGSITVTEGTVSTPTKFYISRLGSTTAAVTVNLTYGGTATMTADYTAPASVVIPAGTTGVDVPVTIVNDTLAEGTETITLDFAAGSYSRGPGAIMYLADNDTNTQTVAFSNGSAAGLENVTTVNVPVTLATAAAAPVTVEYLVDSGTRNSTTSTNTSATQPLPYWVRLVKTGTSFASFASKDGVTWTQLGTTQPLSGFTATNYLAGLAVCAGADGSLCTVNFDNLTIDALSAGGSTGAVTSADIGAVAAAGSWSQASGVYTITGSGADIWNTVDEFRYVWFPVNASANCTITARITSQTNTAAWAKAGVMIRETNAAGSRQAIMAATPGNGRTFQYRATTSSGSTSVANTTTLLRPFWLRMQRTGDLFTASHSSDGSTWSTVGTPQTMVLPPESLAGLAVSARNDDGTATTATVDNVSLTGSPPFAGRTVGFVNAQGTDSVAGGIHTLSAVGAQIGGNQDECHFLAAPVTGDFTLVARVLTQSGGSANAQAGLMVRESTNWRTRSLYIGNVANAGAEFIYRNTSVTTAFAAGVDFSLADGVLTFGIGEQTKYIPLSIVNDTMDEPNDNLTILLRNPNGAQLGTLTQFTYSIIDDDNPPAQPFAGFAAASSTVVENAGTAQIAVSLSTPATASCSVDYTTANGTATQPGDYTTTTGTLSFAIGESVKFISVPITDDAVLETSESLTITLNNPVNAVLNTVTTHTLTITDEDSPAVSIVANDPSASESGDAGQFTLTRTGDTTNALAVTLTRTGNATDAADHAAISTTQTIPAGQASLVINVTPTQDTINEGNETIIFTVAAGSGYVIGTPSTAAVNLADDDRSTVTLVANDANASETAGNPGQFTLTRTAPTTASLSVSFTLAGTASTTAGTDYASIGQNTANPPVASVSIPAGASSAVINITPINDSLVEGPEDVTLSLSSGSYDIGSASFANVTIADNDIPPTVFIDSPSVQTPLVASTNGVIVSAQVSDDGTPNPLSTTWSCVSGPGTATIESPTATTTAVTFSSAGTYVLRISVTDGQFTVSDQTTVLVGNEATAGKWLTQDLGPSSARRGQGLEYGGLFSVTGTGAGYAATLNDQAHVMLRDIVGDGSVVARVTSFSTAAALAGVTIRDSLNRGSNRAVLGFVPGTGLQFRTRAAAGNDTVISTTAPALPFWLKLDRNATTNEISASFSSDGTSWTAVGSPVAVPLLNTTAYYGLTTTSNNTGTTATALFDSVSLTPAPTAPALLSDDNSTAPNAPGSASFNGTTYTVAGSTSGYFYGWQYFGDLDMRCRLVTYSSGAGSSSGGIRIAESIEGGALLHLGRKPTSAYNGYYWTNLAGGGGGGVPSGIAAGNWMRIVRRGNAVTGYRATHNSTTSGPNAWTQIGQPQTIIMTTPVWVGFFVDNNSGATGTLNTCTFTNLSVTALNKAPIVAATASVVPNSYSPLTLDGTLTDDELPAAPSSLWSLRSGPGGLVFADSALTDTTATLASQGIYAFRLSADDTGTKSFFDFSFNAYTSPFAQWLDQSGTGNENNPLTEATADADGDGIMNLLEYAVGTNGVIQNASPQVVELTPVSGDQYLRLSIPKNPAATDVTFIVEASSNLTNWSSAGLIIETNTANQLIVRDTIAVTTGVPRFMRVRVTR
jgi:regulation of enolase protein 1 (concanavalin A-like superfamily)